MVWLGTRFLKSLDLLTLGFRVYTLPSLFYPVVLALLGLVISIELSIFFIPIMIKSIILLVDPSFAFMYSSKDFFAPV